MWRSFSSDSSLNSLFRLQTPRNQSYTFSSLLYIQTHKDVLFNPIVYLHVTVPRLSLNFLVVLTLDDTLSHVLFGPPFVMACVS